MRTITGLIFALSCFTAHAQNRNIAFDVLSDNHTKAQIATSLELSYVIPTTAGAIGEILTSQGAGVAPIWAAPGASSNLTLTSDSIVFADSPYAAGGLVITIFADTTLGAITVDLPDCTLNPDRQFHIKNIGSPANVVTIDPSGAQTIENAATYPLPVTGDALHIQCQAGSAAWWIL